MADKPKLAPAPQRVWTCWRCTHPLCTRLAQSWEIDNARFQLRHQRDHGDNEEAEARLYLRLEQAAVEVTDRLENPPRCIGVHQGGAPNYFSHAAAPMELVEVGVVDEIRQAFIPEFVDSWAEGTLCDAAADAADQIVARSRYVGEATDQGGSDGKDQRARSDGRLDDRVGSG